MDLMFTKRVQEGHIDNSRQSGYGHKRIPDALLVTLAGICSHVCTLSKDQDEHSHRHTDFRFIPAYISDRTETRFAARSA